MTNPQGVSFIPKQNGGGRSRKKSVRKVYVLAYISFVLFLGTLLAAGGTWFYTNSIKSDLVAQQQKLNEERERFSPADIERLKELENRLNEAASMLDSHVSVRTLLEAIERITLEPVQVISVAAARENDVLAIDIEAKTLEGFNDVLFQRAITQSSPLFSGAVFTDVSLDDGSEEGAGASASAATSDEEENVTFTIEVALAPTEVAYEASLTQNDSSSTEVETNNLSASSSNDVQ